MHWLRLSVVVLAVFLAQPASAAQIFIQVFLDDAPLRGVEATLDRGVIGVTDGTGSVGGFMGGGEHTLLLSDGEFAFPVDFEAGADDEVEVSVTFTRAEGDPVVRVNVFAPGESADGIITGTVRELSGNVVAGVTVTAGDVTATTDASGIYQLNVPRGEYEVTFEKSGFSPIAVPAVRVLAGSGVSSQVTLYRAVAATTDDDDDTVRPAPLQIEEVVVLGSFTVGESGSDVERYATSIVNAIDIEQLERFGDGDVAAALTRVVGVAVQDDKYANVRGLDGRYISSTLNGMMMPSTDPIRRDIQLDLFPTNILGGIDIVKAFEAKNPASTTGGGIQIKTKGLPDEFVMKAGSSLGYNFDFTGDNIVSYRGSSTDGWGFDNGLRALPESVLDATNQGLSFRVCDPGITSNCFDRFEAAAVGVQLEDDYNVKAKEAIPNVGLNASWGDRLQAGDGEWGYYFAANYGYNTSVRTDATLNNPFELTGSYERAEESINFSGYGVVGYEYGYANEILSKTTWLRSTEDLTRFENSLDEVEDQDVQRAILQWVERQFASQAFTGHNEFDFGDTPHELDWGVSYSRTDRYEPDRRGYQYFGGFLSTTALERRWSDLVEDAIDFNFDYAIPFDWGDANVTRLEFGGLYSTKAREVDLYRFGFNLGSRRDDILPISTDKDLEQDILSYQNFAFDRVRLRTATSITDSYESDEDTTAYYAQIGTEIADSWSFMVGARYEDWSQELRYPNAPNANNSLDVDNWYPMANAAWRPMEELQFRAAYSQTVSYPGIIERADSQSFDPVTDDPIFGNPDLIESTIDNFDIRAEWYFSETESVSLAFFYKDITNPIERALPLSSGSAAFGITFRNQESAELYGVELDVNVDLVDGMDWLIFAGGNLSYIDSEVQLDPLSLQLEGQNANGRPLQGQSEYLANFQLGFDHYPTEQKFTVLVNYFDDRIFRIARGAAAGPEIEVGRTIIDLTYEKKFGDHWTVGAQVKNLLNDDVAFSQNERTIESWLIGTQASISATYDFL